MNRTDVISTIEPFLRETADDDCLEQLALLHQELVQEELESLHSQLRCIQFASYPSAAGVIDTAVHAARQGWISELERSQWIERANHQVALQKRRLEQARSLRR